SLGEEDALREVARLCATTVADRVAIDILADEPARAELHIREPAELWRPLGDARVEMVDVESALGRCGAAVMEAGEGALNAGLKEHTAAADAGEDAMLATLRAAGWRSLVSVPMHARGRPLGIVTLAIVESPRMHDASDVAVVEDLGRRIALALDN